MFACTVVIASFSDKRSNVSFTQTAVGLMVTIPGFSQVCLFLLLRLLSIDLPPVTMTIPLNPEISKAHRTLRPPNGPQYPRGHPAATHAPLVRLLPISLLHNTMSQEYRAICTCCLL